MPIVVGIDEAGYGPLLGPLVVGATVWQVAPDALDEDFWKRLGSAVCRTPARRDWRLAVNDSKKLYSRTKGIAAIERPVLAFASAAGRPTNTIAGFLEGLGGTVGQGDSLPPWYRDLTQPLPLDRYRSEHAAAAERLRRCSVSSGVRCCGLLAEVLAEDQFNQRVAQTRNKAAALLEQVLRLIFRAGAQVGDQDVHVHVDRLGGRQEYRKLLLTAFPDRHLHVQDRTDTCSRYRLASQRSDWLVDFEVDADQRYLPVALASMLAKYVRELLMSRFNAHWREWLPDLRPTAGYYQDAQRFLAEIRPVLGRVGLREEQFVRQR